MEDELQKATQLREEEHAEYVAAKKDDEDAVALVHDAKAVLEGFYKENGLMLAQRQRQPDIVVQAGMAPPPPPSTWETPYEGQIPEATGIVSVLTMILEDIKSDIEKAVAAEDQAAKAFDVAKLALTKDIENLNTLITSLSKTQGEKEEEVETTKNERRAKQGSLDAVLKKIAEAESGCSYFTVNFGVRSRNRQIEIDGLIKAKAILQGADFAMPADPSRELHPGDALLQLVQSRHS